MDDDPATRFRENITGITAVVVTGLWLSLLLAGAPASLWLPLLILGYVVVVPLVALLFGDEADIREWWDEDELGSSYPADESEASETTALDRRDALERLRDRYAAGELTDEQFEAKLERLLQTETIEDVEYWKRDRHGNDHERGLDEHERALDDHERDERRHDGRDRDRKKGDSTDRDEQLEYDR